MAAAAHASADFEQCKAHVMRMLDDSQQMLDVEMMQAMRLVETATDNQLETILEDIMNCAQRTHYL